jgi:hypothetical protein
MSLTPGKLWPRRLSLCTRLTARSLRHGLRKLGLF